MINILVSFDDRYMKYTEVMLYSLCKHTDETVRVWLLNKRLTVKSCDECRIFLKTKCRAELEVIAIDASVFNEMPTGAITIETYSRVIAQHVLPADLDRILWLDGDIIINRDIAPFYHQDMGDSYCVACKDNWSDTEYIKNHQAELQISPEISYFNAGVLLLNLEVLRKEVSLQNVASACTLLKPKILFADQDVLNYLYAGRVKYADKMLYNCQRFGKKEEENQVQYDQVVILHYTGVRKPWDIRFLDKRAKYYWKMYAQCGGFDHVLHCAVFYIFGGLFALADGFLRTCCPGLYNKLKEKI